MSESRKVSIVVPVYWNEQSLAPLFSELQRVETELARRDCTLELIFVDDGSGDRSIDELLKIKQQREATKIIKLTRNFGAIHASKTGFHFVTGECFMILAADLQDPPELILQMVERWQAGCKFVMCARIARHDPLGAKMLSALYYWLLRLFVVKDYPKGGFDLALMDRALLPYLQGSSKNINTPLFAYWLGFKPEIIHYRRRERQHGKSMWSLAKRLKFFLDSILGFSIVPIRAISLVGLVVSLLSFAYGLLIFVNTVLGHRAVPGFATIVALMSFLLGLIIIMLGVIGEYLWRIFDEVNKRPESVIDEIY
ncbi:MAG: glycosyltransferase family 2 protein [Verrucomicrobiota bacterium]|nr:glycosyltransferase family 2 protein [Verrucomicrobiota bacterium]